jgi:hypothetical protein
MYGIEVFPMNWWLDNTLAKAPNTSCHHCHHHEVIVRFVTTETTMSSCMGCKACKKTWVSKPSSSTSSSTFDNENSALEGGVEDDQEQQQGHPDAWMLSDDGDIEEEAWRFEHGLGTRTWAWNVGVPVRKSKA